MTSALLKDSILVVVAADAATAERHVADLEALGASAQGCIVDTDAIATLSAASFDAVLFDLGANPARFVPVAAALRGDPRTRELPLVVLAEQDTPLSQVAPLGTARIVIASETPWELVAALADAVTTRRAVVEGIRRTRTLEERLRGALLRLSSVRSEVMGLTHDIRVLFGIILGFGANLRDGIVGALGSAQAEHVAHILDASNDAAALLDRCATMIRARPGETLDEVDAATSLPRGPARRTLQNLADLVRATVSLFESTAAEKQIALAFVEEAAPAFWCDAMQIKQVVTNLLVNALKFTPAGGTVTITVRTTAPVSSAHGRSARRQAELVVTDTGPGVPEADRERIFVRGIRLERHADVPGSGIGLAVVREVVELHGGSVHVEPSETTRGASFIVTLPVDMRSRERGIVLLRNEDAANKLVATLGAESPEPPDPELVPPETLARALEGCEAVVLVPRGPHTWLDDLLGKTGARGGGPRNAAHGESE